MTLCDSSIILNKHGRKRPLDTPERKIKRKERDSERERKRYIITKRVYNKNMTVTRKLWPSVSLHKSEKLIEILAYLKKINRQ